MSLTCIISWQEETFQASATTSFRISRSLSLVWKLSSLNFSIFQYRFYFRLEWEDHTWTWRWNFLITVRRTWYRLKIFVNGMPLPIYHCLFISLPFRIQLLFSYPMQILRPFVLIFCSRWAKISKIKNCLFHQNKSDQFSSWGHHEWPKNFWILFSP